MNIYIMKIYFIYLAFCNFIITDVWSYNCTENPLFPLIIPKQNITLCQTADDRVCAVSSIEYEKVYHSCLVNGNLKRFAFSTVKRTRIGNTFPQCLDGRTFSEFSFCSMKFDNKFYGTQLKRYEYYTLNCEGVRQIYPCETQNYVELIGYDSFKYSGILVLFPTLKITCVSYCLERVSKFIRDDNSSEIASMFDEKDDRVLRIKWVPQNISYLLRYICIANDATSWDLTFQVIKKLKTCVFNKVEKTMCSSIRKRLVYDAGEKIHCHVEARYNLSSYSVGISQFNILIKNSTSFISKIGDAEIIVNEGLNTESKFEIHCYIGDYSMRDKPANKDFQYYYPLGIFPVNFKGRYVTSLLYKSGKLIIEADIEENETIVCNETYYRVLLGFLPKLTVNVVYNKEISYPLSSIISDHNSVNYSIHQNELLFRYKEGYYSLVYCTVGEDITSPIIVVTGERPQLVIFNEFPMWDLEYTLDGFVYGCTGNYTTYIEFKCLDCTEDVKFELSKSDNSSYISFNLGIRLDRNIMIACTGYSRIYDPKTVIKYLKLISTSLTKINDTQMFFMETDVFNCIGLFNTMQGNETIVHRVPLPTLLKINNDTYQTSRNEMWLPLNRGGRKAKYQACCPIYMFKTERCELRELLIVENYTTQWNRALDYVYPGSEIQCALCVDYTEFPSGQPCIYKNKIRSHIGIKTTFPDYIVDETPCSARRFSVRSPNQRFLADNKTLEPMSSYRSEVTCCIKRGYVVEMVGLKSCNEYPTQVIIIPKYITLFTVNSTFSCTTEDIECQQGIIFRIHVRKPNYEVSVIGSSYQFTYNDIGNRVHLTCSAGTISKSSDERNIRVEQKPFNVKITGLYKVMWPGLYLRCQAQGFPNPTITWIQTGGLSPLRVSENFLLIGNSDISGVFSVTCEAKNKQGVSYDNANFTIFNPEIPIDYSGSMFYFVVPGLTIMLILLMFASLAIIFQEDVFGAPFFSTNRAGKNLAAKPNLAEIFKEQLK